MDPIQVRLIKAEDVGPGDLLVGTGAGWLTVTDVLFVDEDGKPCSEWSCTPSWRIMLKFLEDEVCMTTPPDMVLLVGRKQWPG